MKKRFALRVSWRVVVGVAVVGAVALVSLYNVPTTFSISATTQVYDIVIGESHRAMWRFRDAKVFTGYEAEGRAFTGTLLVLPGTHVTFERTGAGPLRLRCEAVSGGEVVAKLYEAEDAAPRTVQERLVLIAEPTGAPDGAAHVAVLPMSGSITLGMAIGDVLSDPPTLLLGGAVTMIAHTFIGEQRYDAGGVALDMGDMLDVRRHGDAYGLLVVGREDDLSLIFRVVAKRLQISRFGAQGYDIYATPLTRIKHDPALQAIWAGSMFILGLLAKWKPKPPQEPDG